MFPVGSDNVKGYSSCDPDKMWKKRKEKKDKNNTKTMSPLKGKT